MFGTLLVVFIVLPIAELFLLVRIGAEIGILPTIGLVVGTGLLGSAMARSQGVRVVREAQAALSRGEMPTASILEGILVFVAGLLLITPGVLTDLLGFALLVPKLRGLVAARLGDVELARRYFRQAAAPRPRGLP